MRASRRTFLKGAAVCAATAAGATGCPDAPAGAGTLRLAAGEAGGA
ncbi:twin-arginine translocation signal domain-containing protein, partial [Actinomadura roseirufa]